MPAGIKGFTVRLEKYFISFKITFLLVCDGRLPVVVSSGLDSFFFDTLYVAKIKSPYVVILID